MEFSLPPIEGSMDASYSTCRAIVLGLNLCLMLSAMLFAFLSFAKEFKDEIIELLNDALPMPPSIEHLLRWGNLRRFAFYFFIISAPALIFVFTKNQFTLRVHFSFICIDMILKTSKLIVSTCSHHQEDVYCSLLTILDLLIQYFYFCILAHLMNFF